MINLLQESNNMIMNKCVHGNKILTDLAHRADHDPLILHISESWLDSFMDKKSIVGKINLEIETFLNLNKTIGVQKIW